MKKSEKIRRQAEREENDLKSLGLYPKIPRKDRLENFEKNWLDKFKEGHICKKGTDQSYTLYSARFGVIDFFPAQDMCLLRKKQRRIKPGLEFLVKNLLLK
jgi:hypothetical protein